MNDLFRNIAEPQKRRYLYRIFQALAALLAVYGVIEDAKLTAIGLVLAAVFGVADGNTPVETDEG